MMRQLFAYFRSFFDYYLKNDDQPYILFGVFGVITYPLYYFIWAYFYPIGYENLPLRMIVVVLCIPLVLKNYWPKKLIVYRPFYWHFVLIYCLSFLFTFLLFKNNFSSASIMNTLVIIVLSILLMDTGPLLINLVIGSILGFLVFAITTKIIVWPEDYRVILITYSSVIIFGILFARRRTSIQEYKRINSLKMLSASLAHELRTPLRSILNNANMKTFMPDLIKTYVMAKEAKLSIPLVRTIQLEGALEGLEDIEKEAKYANSIIDMLLINIRGLNDATLDMKIHSMASSINETLERYPFYSEEQKALVTFNSSHDFEFQGDQRLISQILFNLIKNALFFIAKAHKGEIVIQLKSEDRWNCMIFEDTSEGIPKNVLPHIFEQFFSRRENGTGIGLAFCQMAMRKMGGNIRCESEYGVYTRFIMRFPKV